MKIESKTVVVKCLQEEKESGVCEPCTLIVVVHGKHIADAEAGWRLDVSRSQESIMGWGDLDAAEHFILDGPCHRYLVGTDSSAAKRLGLI